MDSATATTTQDRAVLMPMRLPNGTTVVQLNPAETSLQYRDIVATRAYLQHGLTVEPGATVSDVVAEHELERIDLLKINVEKAEADVLAGIDENNWPKIWQLTMQIHDIEDRVRAVRADLEGLGYEVAVDQDPLLVGTDIFD